MTVKVLVPSNIEATKVISDRYALEALKKAFPTPEPLSYTPFKDRQAIYEELLEVDNKDVTVADTFKFGVLYCDINQSKEEQMFSNREGSPDYNKFLELLGNSIVLKDWPKFDGGLDTRSDATGPTSIFTEWNGYEIMYHVSTMLPHSSENEQQVWFYIYSYSSCTKSVI